MLEEIAHIYGGRVLDLGCGTGALLQQVLEEAPGRKLTGLGLSEKMVQKARQRLEGRAELVLGDSEHLPFAVKAFDLVYCNDSFHHYPAPENVLAEVSRAVKKLMQQGLVAEEKDGIAPTPLGRRAVEELAEKWRLVSWKTLRGAVLCERDGLPGADGD